MKRDLMIPKVTFRIRTGDEVETDGGCAIGGQWVNKTTDDFFKGKRVVLFSLPGAFTPTCSSLQLPGFEENYEKIKGLDVDEIYCVSVNDSFVMNAWAKHHDKKENGNIATTSNGPTEDQLWTIFESIDANGNGYLETSEVKAAIMLQSETLGQYINPKLFMVKFEELVSVSDYNGIDFESFKYLFQ